MPRPTTKINLLEAADKQLAKLFELISSMPQEEQTAQFCFEDRDKNIRDILIHLYEWQQLLLNWAKENCRGIARPFLPAPYNWKTYPKMNIAFWEKHQSTLYNDATDMLKKSHADVIKLIKKFSDEELFLKKHFTWTGTTTLASYCISATSSHYDWAIKKVKQHIKTYKKAR